MTRAALAAAGFVRMESEGMVWFSSVIPSVERGTWAGGDTRHTPAAPPDQVPRSARDDSGGVLVLLHGVNDQAGTWFTVAPALAQRFRVILPDLPGHGESDPRTGALPISMIVDRIAAILPEEPFTLLGNSLGGWIAMLYTLRHPERVRTLILEAAGGLSRPFAVPVLATNREEAEIILRAVHGPKFNAPDWAIEGLLARAQDSPMLRVTEAAEHYVDARLGDIRVPTHLLWGADDGVLPLSYADELRCGIPGAQLHVLEGAAHIPHLQQPQRFLECLTAIS
ncbi:MAG: alpha/beta fold hydrolase [Thermoanaerobaculia bacterium]